MTKPLRVFVALPVPDDVVRAVDQRVGALRDRYPDLRWARPGGWHVTLAFLGDIPEGEVDTAREAVAAAVEETGSGAIELTVGEAGHFNRRVLWLGVEDQPSGAVARLGSAMQAAISSAGLPCDQKSVHPHLTLARTRGRSRLPRDITDDVPYVEATWTADAVEVLSSQLGEGGSRYEVLAEVTLIGG
ncbi:MAG: RNA 2',3'-cyclic phosphodiesterase [Nitriliruptorales bacterium]|nr:RNA 2',3'-cyclic phosphodiesterase [Nitriliruptorales bacterium]